MASSKLTARDECARRRETRLGWVTDSCCKSLPFCHCLTELCPKSADASNGEAIECNLARTANCANKCASLTEANFDAQCPKVGLYSLVGEVSRSGEDTGQGTSSLLKWVTVGVAVLLLICVVGVLSWYFTRHSKKHRARRHGDHKARKGAQESKSSKGQKRIHSDRTRCMASKRTLQKSSSSRQRKLAQQQQKENSSKAQASGSNKPPPPPAPSKGQGTKGDTTGATVPGNGTGGITKVTPEKLNMPSRSFNSRAINTVQLPTPGVTPRAEMTYVKFRNALQ